jgi:hypothetical protein
MRALAVLLLAVLASADVSTLGATANAQYSIPWPDKLPCARFTSLDITAEPGMVVWWRNNPHDDGRRFVFFSDVGRGGDLRVTGRAGSLSMTFSCDAGSASFRWSGPGTARYTVWFKRAWSLAPRSSLPSRQEILSAAVKLVDAVCASAGCNEEARRRRRLFAELLRQPDSASVRECENLEGEKILGEKILGGACGACSVSPTSDRELSVTLINILEPIRAAELFIRRKLPGDKRPGDYLRGTSDGEIDVADTWIAP